MEMWLKTSEKAFRFPVLPPSFFIDNQAIVNKPHILNKGNVSIFGGTELSSISISSFFPSGYYSFCNYTNFPSPYECVKIIEEWRKKGQDIRFIITDTDINIPILIESFEYGEKAGSRDIDFTLSLVEFKPIVVSTVVTNNDANTQRPTPPTPPQRTHKVKPNESLWSIAQKYYGNGSLYPTIKKANWDKYPSLKSNNIIYAVKDGGWELIIP